MPELQLIKCPRCNFSSFSSSQISDKITCPRCRATFQSSSAATISQQAIMTGFQEGSSKERFWRESIFGFKDAKDNKIYPEDGLLARYIYLMSNYKRIIGDNGVLISPIDEPIDDSAAQKCETISNECENVSIKMFQYDKYPPSQFDKVDGKVVLYDSKAMNYMLLGLSSSIRARNSEKYENSKGLYIAAQNSFKNASLVYQDLIKAVSEIGEFRGHVLEAEMNDLQNLSGCCNCIANFCEAIAIYPDNKTQSLSVLGSVGQTLQNARNDNFSQQSAKANQMQNAEESYNRELKNSESKLSGLIPALQQRIHGFFQEYQNASETSDERIIQTKKKFDEDIVNVTRQYDQELANLKRKNLYINIVALVLSIIIAGAWIFYVLVPFWLILLALGIVLAIAISYFSKNIFYGVIVFVAILFGMLALAIYLMYKSYTVTKEKLDHRTEYIERHTNQLSAQKDSAVGHLFREKDGTLDQIRSNAQSYHKQIIQSAQREFDNIHTNASKLSALYLWKYPKSQFANLSTMEQYVSKIKYIDPLAEINNVST
jgi:F0F1-type ATP synthase membrane subunit b/b'